MQGHIHEALTLTVFGNEFLRGYGDHGIWPSGATFKFSNSVIFVDGLPQKDRDNPRLANDPNAWFAWLKDRGVTALHLHHGASHGSIEDYNTAVFGGGGRWLVETKTPKASDAWQSRSEVTDPKAKDKKIWSTTWFRVEKNWQAPPASADLAGARSDLAAVLPEILAFAKAHEEKADFAEYFERAVVALDSPNPLQPGYTSDFDACPSLSLPAKQLIGAVGAAWVFGGMSWWNDGGVADAEANKTYLALTQRLWDALTNAIVAAANSSAIPLTRI